MKKVIVSLSVFLLVLIACGPRKMGGRRGSFGPPDKGKKMKPPLVEIAKVVQKPLHHVSTVSAVLEAEREVQVVSETTGIVKSIFVEEGNWVKKGQLLAKLDDRDYLITLKKAENEWEHQKRELKRQTHLYEEGLLSPEAYAQTQYLAKNAEVALEEAKINVEKTQIHSPFEGLITKRWINVGQQVQLWTPLFTLTDLQPLRAKLYLPAEVSLYLKPNQKVKGHQEEMGITIQGKIERIAPSVDPQTGLVEVLITIPYRKGLKPGTLFTFEVVDKMKEAAIVIPRQALMSELDQAWVYVINDQKIHRKTVIPGWRVGEEVEILKGLKSGEKIVIKGKEGLKEGMKVRIAQ